MTKLKSKKCAKSIPCILLSFSLLTNTLSGCSKSSPEMEGDANKATVTELETTLTETGETVVESETPLPGTEETVGKAETEPVETKEAVIDTQAVPVETEKVVADTQTEPIKNEEAVADTQAVPVETKEVVVDTQTEPVKNEEIATDTSEDMVSLYVTEPVIEHTGPVLPTTGVFSGLTDTQRNSISMLNYLTVLVQDIRASKNSRIYLEETYSSIVDNTDPNAIDNRTLGQLTTILNTLENYRMIAVKRDRLSYIYEQNQAAAIRNVVPSPLALMSAIQSFSITKLAASVVYMAVDSATRYQSASAQADMQYLQSGWELDDVEAQTLHEQRKDTFSYMVKTVNEKGIPSSLALTEEAVDKLVEWENSPNNTGRIRFLISNRETYKAFGGYWLLLARSYYQAGNYEKCLEAVACYEELGTNIFRYDYDYAEILPMAISSAATVLDQSEYVDVASRYADEIIVNTHADRWVLRYFAAQTYIDLAAKTGDNNYLQKAYEITLDAVNELAPTQRSLNVSYLAKATEVPVPNGATKEQKAEIKQYNKYLKASRKTELVPIYEPLLVNCELLFALMDQLDFPLEERAIVDAILHENGGALFLDAVVDTAFQLNSVPVHDNEIDVSFDGEKIEIPAKFYSCAASITLTVSGDSITAIDDWTVSQVKRGTEGDVETFTVILTSKTAKGMKYAVGNTAMVSITAGNKLPISNNTISFRATDKKTFMWHGIEWIRQ